MKPFELVLRIIKKGVMRCEGKRQESLGMDLGCAGVCRHYC